MRYEVTSVFRDAETDPPQKAGDYPVISGFSDFHMRISIMAYYPGTGWNCNGPNDKPISIYSDDGDRYIWLWCDEPNIRGKFKRMIKKMTDRKNKKER